MPKKYALFYYCIFFYSPDPCINVDSVMIGGLAADKPIRGIIYEERDGLF